MFKTVFPLFLKGHIKPWQPRAKTQMKQQAIDEQRKLLVKDCKYLILSTHFSAKALVA